MKLTTVEQRAWGGCRRCGRVSRHGRVRIVRPFDPDWRTRLFIWLYHFSHPYRCIECAKRPPRPDQDGPVTTLEGFP
jgi:hypothetical protein